MQTMNDRKNDKSQAKPSSNTNTGTPSNNQSSLPSISIPKGGGAIRGIGEKFGANPVTGTASASIPIFTSPGRSGLGPSLSLSYDSGMGNGPFGFGWNLSLPFITRKTDKGLPLYQDAEESDTFILSGSEDLVPDLIKKDGQWQRNSSTPVVGNQKYQIQRYRPRIEGLFARIERWTNTTTGETFWRSISKENITSIYGKDEKSRISDPADPSHIFSWLICESYDDKGNAILYQYKAENSQGITPLLNERNKDETTRSANRYLKRIKYGNKIPYQIGEDLTIRSDWMFEAVFDYGEHYVENDQGQITTVSLRDDQHKWHIRLDPFSIYRSGFEVRTYRLCQRVLMFHHFPKELGVDDYLVRATEFTYKESPIASFISSIVQSGYKHLDDDGRYLKRSIPPVEFEYSQAIIDEQIREIDSESLENLPYGIDGRHYQWVDLDGEGVSGILTEQGDAWFYKSNLGGSKFGPMEKVASKPSLSNLNNAEQKLMDLAGGGQLDLVKIGGPTPGFYERNQDKQWENFVPFESFPNIDWNDPNIRLVDLTGDGIADILITESDALTWYPSLAKRGFGPSSLSMLRSQDEERQPRLVFSDSTQSIYLADMSGDGLTDLVRIRNGEVCYWPNIGYGRFGSKVTMDSSPWFDTPDTFDQSRIRLPDIDGSGVTDIIYIGHTDGVKLYFNQSGNSWAEPVLLASFPSIDNLSSVAVLDLLGNGTACLVWSSSQVGDKNRPMRYIDLMGGEKLQYNGQNTKKPRGQKPHLLISIKNNMGAETYVEYASSTKFYLQDKAAGKPWITRLPFPVHVVEWIKTYDLISRNRFVTHYKYHHGYFDGVEREFRGFGMVEHYDTEEFGTLSSEGEVLLAGDNIEEATYLPPIYTKTWFHTGIHFGREHVSNFYAGLLDADDNGEYYREPGLNNAQVQEMLLADTMLPTGLSIEEEREACRALKGSMLRQEIYALDGTPKAEYPYTVSEQNFTIRPLQPCGNNQHAVFFVHPREVIIYQYERNPADPRISHTLTFEVDNFGNVLKQASVGYGRRQPDPDPLLLQTDRDKQIRRLISYTENSLTKPIDTADSYRNPLQFETRTYELTGYTPNGAAGRFQMADFVKLDTVNPDVLVHIFDTEISYEDQPTNGKQRRLIKMGRSLYRPDDLGTALDDPLQLLPLGTVESRAIPGETYRLAFTAGLLVQVFQRAGQSLLPPNTAEVLGHDTGDQGGYIQSEYFKTKALFPKTDPDDHWWVPTGRVFMSPSGMEKAAEELNYASKHFFLPLRYRDPFYTDAVNTESFVTFDSYDLLMLETRDPVGNLVTVGQRLPSGQIDPDNQGNDYRVLQPRLVTDPNRNRMEVLFDALGMIAVTALKGKDDSEGDTLSEFDTDNSLINLTQDQIDTFYDVIDPHVSAPDLLKGATSRVIYDLHRFHRTKEAHPEDPTQWLPVYGTTLTRETHLNDSQHQGSPKIQINFSYSDGFGREIQKKMQAEPGPVVEGGDVVNPRWVCSGWTVFNNKGKIVRQYEPFFSHLSEKGHLFEFGVKVGVSPILFYDPLQRVIATLNPNHTYEKVIFDPWKQVTYDVNDTVAAQGIQTGDPRTDLDIHKYVEKYFAALNDPTWMTWFGQRQGGNMGLEEQKAADKASVHANTPTTAYLDTLGRPFATMNHNRFERDSVTVDEIYTTRIKLDVEGNQREVRDTIVQNDDLEGRIVMYYDYDLLGNRIHQKSMESGERWMLNDVSGKPLRAWDSRDHIFRIEYDTLRRPLRSFVIGADPNLPNKELLTERLVYGEQHPEDELRNIRGKIYLHLDQAGKMTLEANDFKGNTVHTTRRLGREYKHCIDWSLVDLDHIALPQNALEKINLQTLEEDFVSLLESETFHSHTKYDALNRPIQIIAPKSDQPSTKYNIIQYIYNEANLLDKVDVWLDYALEPTGLLDPNNVPPSPVGVDNIDYDAKGQRLRIGYSNGVLTFYEYDPQTFRLVHLLTRRDVATFLDDCPSNVDANWPGCQVQNLHYTYDPIGNITYIEDEAQQTIFFLQQRVEPSAEYTYDSIYRLIKATGREHLGQVGGAPMPHSYNDAGRVGLFHPNDGRAMGTYTEIYEYDANGNLLDMIHNGANPSNPGWTRHYDYKEISLIENGTGGTLVKVSNRLSSTTVKGNRPSTELYAYDNHGNMTQMPQLQLMQFDFKDQLCMTQRQKVNDEDDDGIRRQGERTYYVYDATGQRTRKITELPNGMLKDERIYLGQFEIYHRHFGTNVGLIRETLHIMDDKQRIALVETRNDINDGSLKQLIRYQFTNNLSSAVMELDEQAKVISYEEYLPYGSTSYQARRGQTESSKRYRYTGMERDEESGLNYHGARYYAPWIGKWQSCDPAGLVDGSNLYHYSRNNPILFNDPGGMDPDFEALRFDDGSKLNLGPFQLTDINLRSFDARLNFSIDIIRDQQLSFEPSFSLTGTSYLTSKLGIPALGLKGGTGSYNLNIGRLELEGGGINASPMRASSYLKLSGFLDPSISFSAYGKATSRIDERIFRSTWKEQLRKGLENTKGEVEVFARARALGHEWGSFALRASTTGGGKGTTSLTGRIGIVSLTLAHVHGSGSFSMLGDFNLSGHFTGSLSPIFSTQGNWSFDMNKGLSFSYSGYFLGPQYGHYGGLDIGISSKPSFPDSDTRRGRDVANMFENLEYRNNMYGKLDVFDTSLSLGLTTFTDSSVLSIGFSPSTSYVGLLFSTSFWANGYNNPGSGWHLLKGRSDY